MSYFADVCTKTAVSIDVETTAGGVQRVDREHDALLQDPMLDNMLLRMEEIEVRTLNLKYHVKNYSIPYYLTGFVVLK